MDRLPFAYVEDKWIINKLDKLIAEVSTNIDNYDLGVAIDKIYSFIWNEFCDWYIEIAKTRLYSDDYNTKVQVCWCLDQVFGVSLKSIISLSSTKFIVINFAAFQILLAKLEA